MAFKLQARHALPLLLSTICPYASWGCLFFFNDTATTEISPLSLHDPLPLPVRQGLRHEPQGRERVRAWPHRRASAPPASHSAPPTRLFRVPSTDMAMIGLTWLLLDDRHANLGMHVGMQLDPDPELAQLADRLREVHLALVHVDAELFQLALDVARRDRAVQLVLLAHLHREAELHLGDPGRLGLGGALLRGSLFGGALRLVGDLPLVGLRGRVGEPLGEERS